MTCDLILLHSLIAIAHNARIHTNSVALSIQNPWRATRTIDCDDGKNKISETQRTSKKEKNFTTKKKIRTESQSHESCSNAINDFQMTYIDAIRDGI